MSVTVTVKLELTCDCCGSIGYEDELEASDQKTVRKEFKSMHKDLPKGWKKNWTHKNTNTVWKHICGSCIKDIRSGV